MIRYWPWLLLLVLGIAGVAVGAGDEPLVSTVLAPADTVATAHGPLVVHPFGHASLVLEWRDKIIAVDPVGDSGRYAHLPRPHLILVTHRHADHLDVDTVRDLAGQHTRVITPPDVAESLPANDPVALANGDSTSAHGFVIVAVPAYNVTQGRHDFHPRGRDNGYVLELDGVRVYVSGDTENVPELAMLGEVDVAFLCMNLPWTMSVAEGAAAARIVRPRVLYPYHFRNRDGTLGDLEPLQRELAADGVSEVRILTWY